MTKADDNTRLTHMLEAAEKALTFSHGKQRTDFDHDEILGLALVRLLEIIGEAANRVSQDTQDQHSEIPWPKIVGMRNRLIHGYDVVDLDILWQTLDQDLQPLVDAL